MLILGSVWGPKTSPKLVHKIKHCQFWNTVFSSLEALQVTLESHLEPSMLVLRTPKTEQVWFSLCKITIVAIAVFRYFEVLEVLLGTILAHHGLFNSKTAPKIDPRRDPKIRKACPKIGQLVGSIFNMFWPNFRVHFGDQNPADEIACWCFTDVKTGFLCFLMKNRKH